MFLKRKSAHYDFLGINGESAGGERRSNAYAVRVFLRVRRWRAIGQAVSIYLAIGSCAVTAQDNRPSRATFAEMIAYARLAVGACERLAPDAEGFHALALMRLIKPPITEKEIGAKEKDVKRLRDRLGLRKWCQLYAGEMARARILVEALRRQN